MVEHVLIAPDGHEMIADPVTANLLVSQHGYKHKDATVVANTTGDPEPVLTAEQAQHILDANKDTDEAP